MIAPWALAGYELPHHSFPLGVDGWWRGPKIARADCDAIGLQHGGELPDGSQRLRPLDWLKFEQLHAPHLDANADCTPNSPGWVAARLLSARHAFAAPRPAPTWMAILNLTPDSFSDGGKLASESDLIRTAINSVQHGAKWLDLGAESTRPGAKPVSNETQLSKLLPAIELLLACPELTVARIKISIDTQSAVVAKACLGAGANMINDVSALSDPEMAQVAAAANAKLTIMHMRGTPADMQERTQYDFLLGDVFDELLLRAHRAMISGVSPKRLFLDPGIGFSKTAEQSQRLMGQLHIWRASGFQSLAGPSRKSFMAPFLNNAEPNQRDLGTAGAAALCASAGVDVIRLHTGEKIWDAAKVAWGCTSTNLE
ncbi:MAG: dihydropteroate synthase [Planctomycetes bacterium]|nr:dihydropteroate synthase [Planctomycetota bacterium]MBT4029610.1 dihydropteroate synthase [Planctomycetota bacterium]MBT4560521.1 dihydropteroate synthase [Planctomycetota bacterium]MBT5100986.1 dihydropteroate synthase [Planctomycetota bacterium]MBT7013107.1 dihydropteroate synthase [Planctomycetota bacterium]